MLDELAGREVLDLVDDEPLAADHPALADEEHLDRGLEVVLGQPDHVEVLAAVPHHLLLGDGLAHALEPIPDPGRLLELQLGLASAISASMRSTTASVSPSRKSSSSVVICW